MQAVAMSMPQLPMALSRESLGTGMESECHCPACCTCRSLTNLEGSNGGDSGANKRKTCPLRRTLESDPERRRGRADTARTSTASSSSATSLIVGAKRGSLTESNVKYRMEKMLDWFDELDDQQRNVYLRKIIERCRCAQLHFLSVAMEGNLHRFCPHNCQDILSWLPPAISHQILSYLSPRDLCHSSQVSTSWNVMASHYHLWEMLCRQKEWQLSEKGEKRQIKEYSDGTGTVEWKSMFSERYRMRRNWLTGRYTVRTFEGHSQGISCVQFGESKIVSGSSDKTIKVWDIHTNKPWSALTLAGHSATVRCLQLHGDKRLVSGSADQTIKVWDLTNTGRDWSCAACRATMVGHLHTVRCLQVDDQKIVSGSYDKTLKVWNMTDGQCKLTLRGHDEAVLCLQYDASKMVSGSADKKIKIWDLERGRCLHTLSGHHEAVTCLHFDETRIISGSVDSDIKFWDLRTNKCVGTLDWIRSEGHTGVVRHLQADKWRIVSAADDKTLKVWSIETGQRLSTLRCHTDGVTCLQFNDWMMVSGSYDKTVKLYDFSVC
ncbi:F-box/WD repeat-containing protein 7-like [Oscarella lobularis]|uniref:F-box/WD repeat-containing protein 7-like n=1 Tax=Oscarella lobularis TaxID=121494 RepID=UPI0033136FDB